jgi:hypothetical protein
MEDMENIYQRVVGTDENGEARAICCLMIEKRQERDGVGPVVQELAYMLDACVAVSFTEDFAVVDLFFEDNLDYEYLQAGELCQRYSDMADVRCLADYADGELSLVLSLVAKGEYEVFLTGLDAAWSFMPQEPEGVCSVIRLIFMRGKFGVYEFVKEVMEGMIGETVEEVENVDEDCVG